MTQELRETTLVSSWDEANCQGDVAVLGHCLER